jgi:hypothetical protein
MSPQAVTRADIERIFEVLERLDISREAVVIPLGRVHPGAVRSLPKGKIEILVEAEGSVEDWMPELERLLVDLRAR